MEDDLFMRRALDLAGLGRGNVSPNPLVGAVFVRDGEVLAQGFHRVFGGDHAEIDALKSVDKKKLKGATLYVTLEPCCFSGKTPPCTDSLVGLGLKRIVVAMLDPNRNVSGKGVGILRKAGIAVDVGMCEFEARKLNQGFIVWITHGRPFVTLKTAMSLDGKICCRDGSSRWITGNESRRKVHELRAEHDAILVGIGTVLNDDPHLGVRECDGKDPLRIVLDSTLHIINDAQVLRDKNVLLVTTDHADKRRVNELQARGVELLIFPSKIFVLDLLSDLASRGIVSVLVEGGASVNGSFADCGVVDRYVSFIAPKIIGGIGAKSPIDGQGAASITAVSEFQLMEFSRFGNDLMVDMRKKLY